MHPNNITLTLLLTVQNQRGNKHLIKFKRAHMEMKKWEFTTVNSGQQRSQTQNYILYRKFISQLVNFTVSYFLSLDKSLLFCFNFFFHNNFIHKLFIGIGHQT
jgi:hypothetical protein